MHLLAQFIPKYVAVWYATVCPVYIEKTTGNGTWRLISDFPFCFAFYAVFVLFINNMYLTIKFSLRWKQVELIRLKSSFVARGSKKFFRDLFDTTV